MKRLTPGPGQESVWDYPRPPRLEPNTRRLRVEWEGVVVAETARGWRLLERSHPPTYYFPPGDVHREFVRESRLRTVCEYKGVARYWSLEANGQVSRDAAWSYPQPSWGFEEIRDCLAFYPSRVDACYVDDELVLPQPGGFYGGWITSHVVGPFKGVPGSQWW